jgi:hypothetical protein
VSKKSQKRHAEVPGDDLITQAEAAELRGSSIPAINDLVKRGRLRSIEKYGKVLVYRSDVLAFVPSKGGRPRKDN